jgi:GrpB-like predicted nucleotidyltransferase (UPF0157 family)
MSVRRATADDRHAAAEADLARAGVRNGLVELVAYDPAWPALYEIERERLEPLLLGALEIHHIGSTRAELERRLYLRDRLRADPALADEYVALKRALAARYPEDRDTYTEAKAPFIKRVERQAGLDASVARPRV